MGVGVCVCVWVGVGVCVSVCLCVCVCGEGVEQGFTPVLRQMRWYRNPHNLVMNEWMVGKTE